MKIYRIKHFLIDKKRDCHAVSSTLYCADKGKSTVQGKVSLNYFTQIFAEECKIRILVPYGSKTILRNPGLHLG